MTRLASFALLCLLSLPVVAQSLDELPPDVTAVAQDAVEQCNRIGGKPDFEPLELVKFLTLGIRDAYVIDTRALRCKGGKNARKDRRVHCRDDHCKLIVMVQGSGSSFVIAYRDLVERWSKAGGNALNVTINREPVHLVLQNGSLVQR